MMIDVLHEMLDLTGSRLGCGIGICHACVVIWDRDDKTSEEVRTCITGAGFFDGKRIRTIEGIAQTRRQGRDRGALAGAAGLPRPVQLPMRLLHAGLRQCRHRADRAAEARAGAARTRSRRRSPRRWRSHICRCTGYVRYYQAVRDVILATPGLTRDARMSFRRLGAVGLHRRGDPLLAGVAAAAFVAMKLLSRQDRRTGAGGEARRPRWSRAENISPRRRIAPPATPRRAARLLPAACAMQTRLRHDLRHQHHARSRQWHRPLERRGFLARAA